MNKVILLIFTLVLFSYLTYGQEETKASSSEIKTSETSAVYDEERQAIFDLLKSKDSLLFKRGFDHCDTSQLRILLSDDLEFYHDQSGITDSKEDFIVGISGLCHLSYKPTRKLLEASLEVHLLKNNGKIYGALQKGIHEFYGEEAGKAKYLTSTAKFTHVWIIEGGDWKLKRVLSYDHVVPK